jgi:hypothetical protein
VFWLAFSTGYGAAVSPWLHPFVPDDKWAQDVEERKLEEANPNSFVVLDTAKL